ncbi:MAG: hypothetical protein AAGA81_24330 [Acidobacteriota bacterium]
MEVSNRHRTLLLVFAALALAGPNALYLYAVLTIPSVSTEAMNNPVALAFMTEAMMLLGLFLTYVFRRTRSWTKVAIYFVLSFAGSLAFSFPAFLYWESRGAS